MSTLSRSFVDMLSLATLLFFTISASATDVLIPLYVYPGADATNWTPIAKLINTYSAVQWQIVINPQTGPGTNSSDPYPNDDYIAGIKKLDKYSNVKMIGYVDTQWGKRSIDDVKSDLNAYAAWSNYTAGDIKMQGIFFDDVPSTYDFQDSPGTQSTNESYFNSISAYAYSSIKSTSFSVICNSGNPAPTSFFQYCDTIVEFENAYSTYSGTNTLDSITSNGGALSQSAILYTKVPSSITATELVNVVTSMSKKNVQFIGMTNDCCYSKLNSTLLGLMAAACNATSAEEQAALLNSAVTGDSVSGTRFILVLGLAVTVFGSYVLG